MSETSDAASSPTAGETRRPRRQSGDAPLATASPEGTTDADATYVPKACAYVTRNGDELLVFERPDHDGLQVPKGTIEPDEPIRRALVREVVEESGLRALGAKSHQVTDVWTRRRNRRYVRHFFHVRVHEPRDRWTHTVLGDGRERGSEFEYEWVELPTDREFALALDDYVPLLARRLR
jgi:8-oxo-dGTP pyrophosphatase MutT (NUDIX family)